MKIINVPRAITSIIFGTCVTTATLSNAAEGIPMDYYDLDHFQIDCSLKQQQVEFLNSMRMSETEMRAFRLQGFLTPWTKLTDPNGADRVRKTGNGDYNWLINQHLYSLATQCY